MLQLRSLRQSSVQATQIHSTKIIFHTIPELRHIRSLSEVEGSSQTCHQASVVMKKISDGNIFLTPAVYSLICHCEESFDRLRINSATKQSLLSHLAVRRLFILRVSDFLCKQPLITSAPYHQNRWQTGLRLLPNSLSALSTSSIHYLTPDTELYRSNHRSEMLTVSESLFLMMN